MNSSVMGKVPNQPTPWALLVMRWAARIIGLALGGLVLTFIIGEGSFPGFRSTREWLMAVFFFSSIAGMILGWRWEVFGGILNVASMGGFYLVHFWFSNFTSWPRGWVIPTFFIPGLLLIMCAILEKRKPLPATA